MAGATSGRTFEGSCSYAGPFVSRIGGGRVSTPLTRGFVAVHPEAFRLSQKRRRGLFGEFRRLTLTAILYAAFLHIAVIVGLTALTIGQEGFPGLLPMLSNASDAYTGAWVSGMEAITR